MRPPIQAWSAALAVALLALTSTVSAQEFPTRPIRMLVGFSAGSISDNTARVVAKQAEKALGQSIVVENVPGAGATLAAARAAKAPADGYTLLFVAMGHAVAPALYSKLPYDTLNDFTGVATVADARVMLVTQPRYTFKSVVDFVADARTQPGKYSFGSSGNGTFLHLIGESLAQTTGMKLLHVPYKSGAEVVTAVMSGNIDLAFCTVNTCNEHVKSGKVRSLGYIAKARHPTAPEIPTFNELGVRFDVGSYNYVLAPAGTPPAVLRKLHAAINGAVQSPVVRERFLRMGLEPVPSESPESVTAFMKSEVDRWGPVVRSVGLKLD
jgi:tripartite-type tricarboxylate transporter receptor subunit TctC